MHYRFAFLFSFITLCMMGCGGPERTAAPSTAEMGESAKRSVDDFIEQARKAPKTAASQLEILNESLDAYARDMGGDFEKLHETAVELLKMYKNSASQEEIDKQLNKLGAEAAAIAEPAKE